MTLRVTYLSITHVQFSHKMFSLSGLSIAGYQKCATDGTNLHALHCWDLKGGLRE